MALIMMEGFDHEPNEHYDQSIGGLTGDALLNQKGWIIHSGTHFDTGRLPYGSQSSSFTTIQNNPSIFPFPPGSSEIVMGFGIKFSNDVFDNGYDVLYFEGPSGQQCVFGWDLLTRVYLRDYAGHTVYGTTLIPSGTWQYVEIKLKSGGGGTMELHLNGVPGEIPPTPANLSPDVFYRFHFEPSGLGSAVTLDDMYLLDCLSGTNNTDFLGDIVVETLYPINDGTYHDWTVDIGGAHWPRVSEHHEDGNASYVHSTTAGAKDTYGMGAPTLANTPVYGVQLNVGAKKNDAGARVIAPMIRQGGTDYIGPATALTADWYFHSWLMDHDPTGADWLYTTVNNDEFGAELVS